jgi:hypothetical protein
MRAYRVIVGLALVGCSNTTPTANLPTTGTITGTVTSSTGGGLANIALVAVPTLGSGATQVASISQAGGVYSIPSVPVGPGSVITTGTVPSGCTTASASYTMPVTTGTITVNLTVPCGITTGTVYGSVTSRSGAALANVSVVITPSGGKPLAAVTTDATGAYANDSVPASPATGTVSVATLPTGCTAPAPVAYTGLAPVGSVAVNITVNCQEAATTTTGLWIDGQYLLSTAQLAQSGAVTPADSCGGIPAGNTYGGGLGPEAFDASGNLWTQHFESAGGNLTAYTPAQLAAACSAVAPGITVSFTGGAVSALAFDAHGTLWIATPMAGTGAIFGLSAPQIATSSSGHVTPAYTINVSAAPQALAFDTSGNLWVGTSTSIVEYTAAQLTAATTGGSGTSPAPGRSVTNNLGASYAALAFDAKGDLWVTLLASYDSTDATDSVNFTVNADSIVEYTASQLTTLSSSTTPAVLLGESTSDGANDVQWGAIAFDASGNLWLGANLSGVAGVERFPAANIVPGGSGLADVTIDDPTVFEGFTLSLAFNPIPAGLPINGTRVVPRAIHKTVSPTTRTSSPLRAPIMMPPNRNGESP